VIKAFDRATELVASRRHFSVSILRISADHSTYLSVGKTGRVDGCRGSILPSAFGKELAERIQVAAENGFLCAGGRLTCSRAKTAATS
jgi:hypothetical protein